MDRLARNAVRDRLLERLGVRRPLIMGILNVTPDSFSDGGVHDSLTQALGHAAQMKEDGADILDIGGESTRPGGDLVSLEDEWARVHEPLVRLAKPDALPLSIDTYKAEIARRAAGAGAVLVNDVWGMTRDEGMADAVAETESLVCITYNRGKTDGDIDLREDMAEFIGRAFDMADRAGIPRAHILLDPGVGFAKTYNQNFGVLAHLDVLVDTDCPVLVGVSRKSFIGRLTGKPVDERLVGTLAAGLDSVYRGATILRVHDVAAHREALDMFQTIGSAI
ncbi:dihydropteroate synthase [Hyphomonas sp.]|jgi:dihydropteroate synthase|uniref:dihydropteroate synthase n=1 Tax=Hyphomonas sp. TaxID=87 RepID=UPI0032D8EC2B